MKNLSIFALRATALCLLAVFAFATPQVHACTRIVYHGEDGIVLTARTMDWAGDTQSNMWIFPRGMERDGATGENTMRWQSKYGSVVTSAYDICTTDGMNERGLTVNLLWLSESVYPQWDGKSPAMAITVWPQYLLDNFATVAEAVAVMQKEEFVVVSDMMPDGSRFATLHLSISDATGDNAIFEYIDGKLKIHHGREYTVMTNSPAYDAQLALYEYWKGIGGLTFLPGTNRSADRFARASFYVNALPRTADIRQAVAGIFSVIRNTSVPLGISTPTDPFISSTRWRTVTDHKNKIYYFESALQPNVIWVEFNDIDFTEKAPVRRLSLDDSNTYVGNVAQQFAPSEPFKFLGLKSPAGK